MKDGRHVVTVFTDFDSEGNTRAWVPPYPGAHCKPEVRNAIIRIITEALDAAPVSVRKNEYTRIVDLKRMLLYIPESDPAQSSVSFNVHKNSIYRFGGSEFEDECGIATDKIFEYLEA